MTRSYGLTEPVREALAPLDVLFVFVTTLGEVAGLLGLAVLAYWLGPRLPGDWDRRRGLVLVGVALCAITVVGFPKALLDLARPAVPTVATPDWLPPGASQLFVSAAESDSPGFPSGHATSAAAVYGTFLLAYGTGRRRTRLALAAFVVGLVALSRVVIGVHFVVDVVVGILLGSALVALAVGLDRPGVLYGLATASGVGWLLASGASVDAMVSLGFAAGATAVWLAAGPGLAAAELGREGTAGLLVAGVVTIGPAMLLARALAPPPVGLALGLVGGGLALGLPLLVERVRGEKTETASA